MKHEIREAHGTGVLEKKRYIGTRTMQQPGAKVRSAE
jgi:hypothetical protein